MSVITIQCSVVASEATRHELWQIMSEINTPLINELLKQVGENPEFEQWLTMGKLPRGIVGPLCNSPAIQECFAGQPKRFYKSAIEVTEYIYKSWLALQKIRQRRLNGKIRWLSILKSDKELVERCGCSLEIIREKALEILVKHTTQSDNKQKQKRKSKKSSNLQGSSKKLVTILFEAYDQTEDELEHCAIIHLLKNGCQISDGDENAEEFALNRRKKEIEIERLQVQLASRMPRGRDLTGEEWLQTLTIATNTVPKNQEEARLWQNRLLKKTSPLPFPIQFTSNEDLIWSKNHKGRICFKLSGFDKHIFEVYCDRRQLHWFQRFLEDQTIKRSDKYLYSSSLFTLCSGRLAWQEHVGKAKEEPWNLNRLILYCSIDTRSWTNEGTQQVIQEKAVEVKRKLSNMQEKDKLNPNQEKYVQRLESTLAKLNHPYPRPSKALYQPKTSILVGVCLASAKPATVAVVDASTNTVLAYHSVKHLLDKNYKLLNYQQRQQQSNAHKRHKAQKYNKPNQLSESELGKHLDNLLAKGIVSLAQTYQAGSIVVPDIKNVREGVEIKIKAKAQKICPNFKGGQEKYAKLYYRQNRHHWSYRRLINCIRSQAAQAQISIEEASQAIQGTNQEKARDLAIAAYYHRQNKS